MAGVADQLADAWSDDDDGGGDDDMSIQYGCSYICAGW